MHESVSRRKYGLTIVRIFWFWTLLQFPVSFIFAMLKFLSTRPSRILIFVTALVFFNLSLRYIVKYDIGGKYMPHLLSGLTLLGTGCCICFYGNDIAMQILWIFPVMLSLLFFEQKLTLFTTAGSILGLALMDLIQPIQYRHERFYDLYLTSILIILGMMVVLYFFASRIQSLFRSLTTSEQQLKDSLHALNQAYADSKAVSDELIEATVQLAATTEYVNHNVAELALQSSSASLCIERVIDGTKHADDIIQKMLANFDINISQARSFTSNHLVATEKIHNVLNNITDSSNHTEQISQSLDVILELNENLKRRCYEVNKIMEFIFSITDESLQKIESAIDEEPIPREEIEECTVKVRDFCKTAQNIVAIAVKDVQSTFEEVSTIKLIVENETRIALAVKRQLSIIQLIIDRNKRQIEELDVRFDLQRSRILAMPSWMESINSTVQKMVSSMEITTAFSEETSASMQDLANSAKKLEISAELLKQSYQRKDSEVIVPGSDEQGPPD
ncbi:MAG TPA: methyl-accepting chemotaxis protein [Bacillota bacterium]|nr:methyl-accepting chemotaxis protein [Bacillota bacterium]